ncbi:MAG TPA: heavy metal translocating P-type ATPase [Candidatus Dormibacteraeota bacterium]
MIAPADAPGGAQLAGRLAAHPCVSAARWRPAARSVVVTFDPDHGFEQILAELPDCPLTRPDSEQPSSGPFWRHFLTPAIALLAGITGSGVLALAAVAVCALPVARRARQSLRERKLSIDVLDVLVVGLLLGTGDLLAAGVTVCLVETSERIRQRAYGRARYVIRSWMGANPDGVTVQRNGSEVRIALESVGIGDRAVLYPGETIPVDGLVVAGAGAVDMRTWTGEALPHEVTNGSVVLAGSSMADGRIVIEVTAAGDETRAGRLTVALEEALAANTHVTDLARRVADRFVLPVMLASGLVFVATLDLARCVSMLIFDYGTGVRIAIPTTILTTMITGARHGVLFKNGQAVEELARVDTVVFDKTGTLTSGVLNVRRIVARPGVDEDEVLRVAAAAEGHLQHPIARALRRAALRRELRLPEPERVRYHRGGGVEAVVEGHSVVVGDARLMATAHVDVPPRVQPESLSVLVAVDGRYLARIRLRDKLRDSARGAVTALREGGIGRIWLASGDHQTAVGAVARDLRLDGCTARLLPEEKAELVRELRSRGHVVAVVGDGINDAPAMSEANVSIAVPRGADLARETADIVLLTEDLRDLAGARRLCTAAMRTVKENIALVAAPNTAGILLAAFGSLSPLTATLVGHGAVVSATVNALRPLRFRPTPRRG